MKPEGFSLLVVGGGGREHALAWKLRQSRQAKEVWLWPGNVMSQELGRSLELSPAASFADLGASIKDQGIDLVVCGPETPLSLGLADELQKQGIPIFGPVAAAARLESSKQFAKEVMFAAGIPTARSELATSRDACREVSYRYLQETGRVVLKASGLAAGKGVFICNSHHEIDGALARLYSPAMVEASKEIVVEEFLEGREASYFTLLGPNGSTPLGFAVDFKRLGDFDEGPNTGGMGCYTPVPWLRKDAAIEVEALVVAPLLKELERRGISYCGFLYVGLMWTPTGPKVVEFNCRLGDPEAQILAVHDERDWLPLIASKLQLQDVPDFDLINLTNATHKRAATIGVVMAAEGYPYEQPTKLGACYPLADLDEQPGSIVFGAAVRGVTGGVETGSGRVFCVVTKSSNGFAAAREQVYERVKMLGSAWPSCHYRRDIAQKLLEELAESDR